MTGLPRGFGFVHFPDPAQAHAGMIALNNSDLAGRHIYVRVRTAKGAHARCRLWCSARSAFMRLQVRRMHGVEREATLRLQSWWGLETHTLQGWTHKVRYRCEDSGSVDATEMQAHES